MSYSKLDSFTLKRRTITIIVIIAAVIIGFGAWVITPYFTNTTIDEPLPTSFEPFSAEERLTKVSFQPITYPEFLLNLNSQITSWVP